MAVHERSIVAPCSVKELVAFYTDRESFGNVFVVDQAVAEIEKARPSAARDDLLKWVERVKGTRRRANFGISRAAKWRLSGESLSWRDVERYLTRRLEIARGDWRKFVVRLGIHIKEVAKNPQLIVTDLGLERRIPAPALLLGI